MITCISVDGFKSLTRFELNLLPGLNILVGPNGSGKTNIISFFEFLGNLQEMPVSDAISSAGGAGVVFTKLGENKYRPNIVCAIDGNIELRKKRVLFYRYSFEIIIGESVESISYISQRLQFKYRTVITSKINYPALFDLDLETRASGNDGDFQIIVHALDRRKIRTRYGYLHDNETISKEEIIHKIKVIINDTIGIDDSLLHSMRYIFEDWHDVIADLRGGQVFNIVPSQVRIPEDSAKPPGIREDGSGLYATLYAINKQQRRRKNVRRVFRRVESPSFVARTSIDKILKYTQLANDAISKITVKNNPFDNQLQIRIWIQGENESTVLPLSALSDGTIKWISLITIILTKRTIFSIEEPENYLHPLMQAEILSVMRSSMRPDRFILLSTHSETILNHATPEEIVVVKFKDGITTSKRLLNSQELNQEIKETGFGLGYYYIAGSLDDE